MAEVEPVARLPAGLILGTGRGFDLIPEVVAAQERNRLLGGFGSPPTTNLIGPDDGSRQPGMEVVAGKPGSGLLGYLASQNPDRAAQLAPLLKAMPMPELLKLATGTAAQGMSEPQPQAPYSTIGKLQADLSAGRINQDQYAIARDALSRAGVNVNVNTGSQVGKMLTTEEKAAVGLPQDGVYAWGQNGQPKEVFKPTEGALKAGSFVQRMSGAESNLRPLESSAFAEVTSRTNYLAANNPLASLTMGMVSQDYQKYMQAAREWISGLLRYDSGAAVPDSEFMRYFYTYFAYPGEGQEVIRQKQEARERAMKGLGNAANPSAIPDGPSSPLVPRLGIPQGADPNGRVVDE